MVTMAKRTDDQLRKKLATGDGVPALAPVATLDSFINFQHKLGVGADNALSTASYGFNPITRNRNLLEWIHRGSWLGGVWPESDARKNAEAHQGHHPGIGPRAQAQ